jgi:hypothetical protein
LSGLDEAEPQLCGVVSPPAPQRACAAETAAVTLPERQIVPVAIVAPAISANKINDWLLAPVTIAISPLQAVF